MFINHLQGLMELGRRLTHSFCLRQGTENIKHAWRFSLEQEGEIGWHRFLGFSLRCRIESDPAFLTEGQVTVTLTVFFSREISIYVEANFSA